MLLLKCEKQKSRLYEFYKLQQNIIAPINYHFIFFVDAYRAKIKLKEISTKEF